MDMTDIKCYNYEKFTVIAPSKHGTRWLSSVTDNIEILTNTIDRDWKSILSNRINTIPNTIVFVYRDPLECFTSAIRTYASAAYTNPTDTIWHGNMNELDVLIKHNNHFEPFLYETINNCLNKSNRSDVVFVPLNNLTMWINDKIGRENMFTKEKYSFPTTINKKSLLGGGDKIDIINECEIRQPILWKEYMDRIQIERSYLNLLKIKYI